MVDIEFLAGMAVLFGTELYNAIQITKMKSNYENCVYCQKSKELFKKEVKEVK